MQYLCLVQCETHIAKYQCWSRQLNLWQGTGMPPYASLPSLNLKSETTGSHTLMKTSLRQFTEPSLTILLLVLSFWVHWWWQQLLCSLWIFFVLWPTKPNNWHQEMIPRLDVMTGHFVSTMWSQFIMSSIQIPLSSSLAEGFVVTSFGMY